MAVRTENEKKAAASRQRERTETTRARLIQSAEKIFARDGFEAAKLEEIAADAGYTRGAFYANFDSKEDLFFALLEKEISTRIASLQKEMGKVARSGSQAEGDAGVFPGKTLDRRWSLLALEFKLFAVRHPEVKRRLAAMHRRFVGPRVGLLEEMMKALGRAAAGVGVRHWSSLATLGNAAYAGTHARPGTDAGGEIASADHDELLRQPDDRRDRKTCLR